MRGGPRETLIPRVDQELRIASSTGSVPNIRAAATDGARDEMLGNPETFTHQPGKASGCLNSRSEAIPNQSRPGKTFRSGVSTESTQKA